MDREQQWRGFYNLLPDDSAPLRDASTDWIRHVLSRREHGGCIPFRVAAAYFTTSSTQKSVKTTSLSHVEDVKDNLNTYAI